jgi:competence protein ComEA
MRNRWMTFATALALLAGSALAGAATTQDAKPTPVAVGTAAPDKAPSAKPPAAKQQPVNLNAASKEELARLPGGSDEEAARIIAGRPYNSKAFLVTNKVISQARYVEIKSLVVAGEPAKAAAAKK